ncbi:hypothetical protein CI109_105665 [Kwoniella shandongensis]|uniref:Uncharacterized protein n=1 Tax=Kwoniella shandongensis TaxID=1734106 RepID=A0A5M6C0E7_9TREE|nr:uncharacterized protein CI109_003005 [Kwoniella shandongensis]KAA5528473.1 hypothetical protein CI109_003005 [Kwoniella shandongensis]
MSTSQPISTTSTSTSRIDTFTPNPDIVIKSENNNNNKDDKENNGGLPTSSPSPALPKAITGTASTDPISNTAAPSTVIAEAKPFPGHVDAQPGSSTGWEKEMLSKKRKWGMMGYEEEEMSWLMGECTSLHLALLLDQTSTLYPTPPTAFGSYEDAVDRLLPYHVWQVHDEELESWKKGDKEAEIKEAEELVGRIRGIQERFVKARRKEADHPSPLPSLISILNSSTAIVREELTALQATLKPIQAEWNVIETEQKRIQDEKRRIEEVKRRTEEAKRKELLEEEERKRVAKMATEAAKVVVPPPAPAPAPVPVPAPAAAPMPRPMPVPVTPTVPRVTTPTATTTTIPTPVSATPGGDGASERGRPRGRPRGRGRGGLREAVITHTTGQGPATPAGPASTTGIAPSTPAAAPPRPPLPASTAVGTPTPPASHGGHIGTSGNATGTSTGTAQGPVNITVNVSIIPQLVTLGLLQVPPNPAAPKTPATVLRTSDDKKSVVLSINLSACSKTQLLGLAKVLNVSTKPAAVPAGGGGVPSPNPSGKRMPVDQRPTCLLLKDVPKTALPSDVLRALRDVGAIDETFGVSSLTSPPPSLTRAPSLTRTWHLTTPSPAICTSIYQHLSSRPPFNIASSSRLPSSSSSSSSSPSPSVVQYTDSTSSAWISQLISRALEDSNLRSTARGEHPVEKTFTTEWVMKAGYGGRRVTIKGLPGGVSYDDVKRLGKDCGLVEGQDACKRLPPSKFSLVSTFCLTTNTVADAHRLARKVHMKWYKSSVHGEKYLMRAQVVY